MARKFIAALAVTTVVATGFSAASAKAEPANVGDMLAATILLFALGAALNGEVTIEEPVPDVPGYGHGRYDKRKKLPRQCLLTFTTQQGQVRTYEASCLSDNFHHSRRLPKTCSQTLWTSIGIRNGYEPACLRRYGYTMDRR